MYHSFQHKILVISIWLLLGTSWAQSFEHRKFKYQWNDEIKVTLKQDSAYKQYDALVLFEETTIDVEVQNIKRYQILQFNTAASIENYNLFRVPIVMDPAVAEVSNRYEPDTASFPKLLYEKINFFDARIIRNGEFVKAVLDEMAFRSEERTADKLLPYYVHYFYVRNLEPGDQLEVIISHHWPLHSALYYLNDQLPKQEMILTINNDYLGTVWLQENKKLATLYEKEISKDETTFKYVFRDIKPVTHFSTTFNDELPRVEFFYNKTTERSYKLFSEDIIDTLTWNKFFYKYVKRIDPNEPRSWETYDDQTYLTTLYYNKVKQLAPDTTDPYALANFIHNYTTDKLKFKNDFNFFIHEELGLLDLGKFLKNGILREAGRHRYYYQMLDRIDIPYYLVPFQDRRYYSIQAERYGPIDLGNIGYGLIKPDQSVMVMYPKTADFGWYTNELPFYFSNHHTYMIPQTVERKIYDKDPESIYYPYIRMNTLPGFLNNKIHHIEFNIQLDSMLSECGQEIYLQGQFSTLLRGYYLNGWKDTTISPTYYPNFSKFTRSSVTALKVNEQITVEPYDFRCKLTSDKVKHIYETIDGYKIVDLSGIINIHYETFDTNFQFADIRTDFCGKEEFVIDLNFDKLVDFEEASRLNRTIESDEFYLETSMQKKADNVYQIKIIWEVKAERIPSNKTGLLMEAYKWIKSFSKLKLKVIQL